MNPNENSGFQYNTLTGRPPYAYLINWVIAVVNILIIVFYNNIEVNQSVIATMIIITSVLFVIRVKDSKTLFFLISIIAYINISIAVIDGYYAGEMFNDYQDYLRLSVYNQIYLKCILLNITIISIFATPRTVMFTVNNSIYLADLKRKNNSIIAYAGLAVIIYILIFGITRSVSGDYVSNKSQLYEYAIIVFIATWYYCKGLRLAGILLKILAVLYIVQGLYYGDRSSAFLMAALIAMAFIKNISLIKMVFFSLGGILVANILAVVRELSSISISGVWSAIIKKGVLMFFSDTASQSFYTGTTIVASRPMAENPLYFMKQFIISIFAGGNSPLSQGSVVSQFASQYYSTPGGGIYPSYFYFWGGFIAVVIGAVIIGLVIRIVFTNKKPLFVMMSYLITVMSLRWYLYAPLPLFRLSILMFCLLILLCGVFDVLVRSPEKSIKDIGTLKNRIK